MKRWILIGCSILLAIGIGISGYFYYLYKNVEKTVQEIYEPIPQSIQLFNSQEESRQRIHEPPKLDRMEPFTVLLLGVDERINDVGRSDAILVMAVNPAKESVLLFNIPRDTRTEIAGFGTEDKINHAYAFGGVEMSIRTVEKFLNYPINYYIKINMQGFENIVDLIGGIEVHNKSSFSHDGNHFAEGSIKLNGKQALSYSRMRYGDPRGDLGRNQRQRELLKALMSRVLQIGSISKLDELLNEIGNYTATNFSFDEIKKLILNYRPKMNNVNTLELDGKGQMIKGIYYYAVHEQARLNMQTKLSEQMQTND